MVTRKECGGAKRTDVGYKRPPVEHQFKAGQKQPPRKNVLSNQRRASDCLASILAEEIRVMRDGKPEWRTNGSLILEVAFRMAEEGSTTVLRALTDHLIASDPPEIVSDQPRIEFDPDGESGVKTCVIRRKV